MNQNNRNFNCTKSALALAVILGLSGCGGSDDSKSPSAAPSGPTAPSTPSTPAASIDDDAIVDAFNSAWLDGIDATPEQKEKIKDAINALSDSEKADVAEWADLIDIPAFVNAIKGYVKVEGTDSDDLPSVIVVEPDGGREPVLTGKPLTGKPTDTDPSGASLETINIPTIKDKEIDTRVEVRNYRDKRLFAFQGIVPGADQLLYANGFGKQIKISSSQKKKYKGNYPIAFMPKPGNVPEIYEKISVDEVGNVEVKNVDLGRAEDYHYLGRYLGDENHWIGNGLGAKVVHPVKDPDSPVWGSPIVLPGSGNLLYIGQYGSVMMKPNPFLKPEDVISPSYVTDVPNFGEGVQLPAFWDDSGESSFLYVSPEGHVVVVRKPINSEESPLQVLVDNPHNYIPVRLIRDGEQHVYDATQKRFAPIDAKYVNEVKKFTSPLLPYTLDTDHDLGDATERLGRMIVKPGEVNPLVKNPDVPGTIPGHNGQFSIDKHANIIVQFPDLEELRKDKTNWVYRGTFKEPEGYKRLYRNGYGKTKWLDVENAHIPRWGKPAILPVNGNLLYISEIGKVMVKQNPDTWGKVAENHEAPIWTRPFKIPNSDDLLYVSHNGLVLVVPKDNTELDLTKPQTLKHNIVEVIDGESRIYNPEVGQVVQVGDRNIVIRNESEVQNYFKDEIAETELVAVQPNVVNPLITEPKEPGSTYASFARYSFDDDFKLVFTYPKPKRANAAQYVYTKYIDWNKEREYTNAHGDKKHRAIKNPDVPRWGTPTTVPQTGHLLYIAEDGKVMLKQNPETWGKIKESTDKPNFNEGVEIPPLLDWLYVADNGAVLVLPRATASEFDVTDYESIKGNILQVVEDTNVSIYNPLFKKVRKEDPFNVVPRTEEEIKKLDFTVKEAPTRGLTVKDSNHDTVIDFSYPMWDRGDIFKGKDLTELKKLISSKVDRDLVLRHLDGMFDGADFLLVTKDTAIKENEDKVSTSNLNIVEPLLIKPGQVNPLITEPHKPGKMFGKLTQFYFDDQFELVLEKTGRNVAKGFVYADYDSKNRVRTLIDEKGNTKKVSVKNPDVPRWGTPTKVPVTGHLLYIAEDGKVMLKRNPETWNKIKVGGGPITHSEPVSIPHTGDLLYVYTDGSVIVLPREKANKPNINIEDNLLEVIDEQYPTVYDPSAGKVVETDAYFVTVRSEAEIRELQPIGNLVATADLLIKDLVTSDVIDFSQPDWYLNEVFAGKDFREISEMIKDGEPVHNIILKLQEMTVGKSFKQETRATYIDNPDTGNPDTGNPDTGIDENIINDLINDDREDDELFNETINPQPFDLGEDDDSSDDEDFENEPNPLISDPNFLEEELPLGKHGQTDNRMWVEVSDGPEYHVGNHQVHRVRFHNDTDSEMSGNIDYDEADNTTVQPQQRCMKIPSHSYCDEFVNIQPTEIVDGESVNALLYLEDNVGLITKHRITTPMSSSGGVWAGIQLPEFDYKLDGRDHYKAGQTYVIKYPMKYYQQDGNYRGHPMEVTTDNGIVKLLANKGCAKVFKKSWLSNVGGGSEFSKFEGEEMQCDWYAEFTPQYYGPSNLQFISKWHNKGDDKNDPKSYTYEDRLNVLQEHRFEDILLTKENYRISVFDEEKLYGGQSPFKVPEKYGLIFKSGSNNFYVKPVNAKLHDDHDERLEVSGFTANNIIFTQFSAAIQDHEYAINDVGLHKDVLDPNVPFKKEFWLEVKEVDKVTSDRTMTTGIYHVVPWGGYPTHELLITPTYDISHDDLGHSDLEDFQGPLKNGEYDTQGERIVDENGNK